MHTILKVASIALIATVLLVVLREERKEWGVVIRFAVGAVVLLLILAPLQTVIAQVLQLATLVKVRGLYLAILLKVIGIAYIATFAAQMAYDTGESGLGWRVELAGKVAILALSLPLISAIITTILKMIPS
ncbi:MAG: stage III sporulation protein AD [Firmicutes bacterium]|uniref:Stage III sporulation protein AD n=1 Tax=Sulfobacillus benefaciens TaxID=453960 RepID=A0A2T2XFQ7_9FIRM|nr:stage III sporulation protein AD [Bacillota bacterium]PSR33319.1 MAG: stage III sporulation protein AD [Sulfobacillus benefaciens]